MKQEKRITYPSPDYANMSAAARADMQAELERHYFTPRYQCSPFDPTELVALMMDQWPDRPKLAEALGRCTEQWRENNMHAYLQDPAKRRTRAPWLGSLPLLCPRQGELFIDVLKDGSILGIEYLRAALRQYDDERDAVSIAKAPPVLKIVHWK